jgi:hypothetical protein
MRHLASVSGEADSQFLEFLYTTCWPLATHWPPRGRATAGAISSGVTFHRIGHKNAAGHVGRRRRPSPAGRRRANRNARARLGCSSSCHHQQANAQVIHGRGCRGGRCCRACKLPGGATEVTMKVDGTTRPLLNPPDAATLVEGVGDELRPGGAPQASPQDSLVLTFVEAGRVGVQFEVSPTNGWAELVGVRPGSQAARHPLLSSSTMPAGFILTHVNGTPVLGVHPKQMLELYEQAERPLTLQLRKQRAAAEQGSKDGGPVPTVAADQAGHSSSNPPRGGQRQTAAADADARDQAEAPLLADLTESAGHVPAGAAPTVATATASTADHPDQHTTTQNLPGEAAAGHQQQYSQQQQQQEGPNKEGEQLARQTSSATAPPLPKYCCWAELPAPAPTKLAVGILMDVATTSDHVVNMLLEAGARTIVVPPTNRALRTMLQPNYAAEVASAVACRLQLAATAGVRMETMVELQGAVVKGVRGYAGLAAADVRTIRTWYSAFAAHRGALGFVLPPLQRLAWARNGPEALRETLASVRRCAAEELHVGGSSQESSPPPQLLLQLDATASSVDDVRVAARNGVHGVVVMGSNRRSGAALNQAIMRAARTASLQVLLQLDVDGQQDPLAMESLVQGEIACTLRTPHGGETVIIIVCEKAHNTCIVNVHQKLQARQ